MRHFSATVLLSITTNQTEDKFKENLARKPKLSYEDALAVHTLDLQADCSSSEIKATMREAIEGGWPPLHPPKKQMMITY